MFGLGDLAKNVTEILNQSQFRVTNLLNTKADAGLAIIHGAAAKLIATIARNLRLITVIMLGFFAAMLYFQFLKYRAVRELKHLMANIALGNQSRAHEGYVDAHHPRAAQIQQQHEGTVDDNAAPRKLLGVDRRKGTNLF